MPVARAGGIAGPYLSSFLNSYLAAQRIGQSRRESESEDILRALQAGEFLRQRGAEEEGQGVLGQMLARQAARRIAPPRSVSVSTAESPEPLGVFAESVGVPQPGGGLGELIRPGQARPPVLQTLLEGIEPALAARALSRPGFRESLKPIAEAEEERRRTEDRAQAQEFMAAASVEAKVGNYLGFADNYAAAMRRIDRHEEAGRWIERGLVLRKDEDRRQKANDYMRRVNAAAKTWEDDDSSDHWDALQEALISAEPAEQKAYAETIRGRVLLKQMEDLATPKPAKVIQREYHRLTAEDLAQERTPDLVQNWAKAYRKFPQFAGRHLEWLLTQKGGVPEPLRKFLRLPDTKLEAKVVKDVASRAFARLDVEFPGLRIDTPEGMGKFLTLFDEEQTRAETPLAKAQRERIEEQTKLLKSAEEADLTKLDERTLIRQAKEFAQMAKNLEFVSPPTADRAGQLAGEYMAEFNRRRAKAKPGPGEAGPALGRVTVKGIAISPPPPEADLTEAKRLRAAGQTAEAQAIETRAATAAMAEADRLRATKKFKDDTEIVQAMKSAGWPVE